MHPVASIGSVFGAYSRFVKDHARVFLLVWLVLVVVLSPSALAIRNIISYSVNVPSSSNQSTAAENMVSTDFRGYHPSNTSFYVVISSSHLLSGEAYSRFAKLNASLFQKLGRYGLENVSSVYSLELALLRQVLNSSITLLNATKSILNLTAGMEHSLESNLSSMGSSLGALQSNITALDREMNNFSVFVSNLSVSEEQLRSNLTTLDSNLYQIQASALSALEEVNNLSVRIQKTNYELYSLLSQVNSTAYFVYGPVSAFVYAWQQVYRANPSAPVSALNSAANSSVYPSIEHSGNGALVLYYNLFVSAWDGSTSSLAPASVNSSIAYLGVTAARSAVGEFSSAARLNYTQAQFLGSVAAGFSLSNYTNPFSQIGYTLAYATQGASSSERTFIEDCFYLGPDPSAGSISSLALALVSANLTSAQAAFVREAYYGIPKVGVENFTISYFASVLNSTQPGFVARVSKTFGMGILDFLRMVYSVGSPPSQTVLENLTVTLVVRTFPANLSFSKFGLAPSEFAREVYDLGMPLSTPSLDGFVISLFEKVVAASLPRGFSVSPGLLVNTSFSLGPNPSGQELENATLAIAASGVNQSLADSISDNFFMTPRAFLGLVYSAWRAQTGYSGLSVYLLNRSVSAKDPSLVSFAVKADSNVYRFLLDARSLGYPVDPALLRDLSVNMSYRLFEENVSSQPFLYVNATALRSLLVSSYQIAPGNLSYAETLMLSSSAFSDLPVSPVEGLLQELVNPAGNLTVVTLNFVTAPDDSGVSSFEQVVAEYNSTDFITHYTAGSIISKDLQSIVTKSEIVAIPAGIVAAIVITGLFFLSPVAALVPFLSFAVSMVVGFGLVYQVLGRLEGTTLSFISPAVIVLLGLGLATDYSVLILNRYRQELTRGRKEALRLSTRWAGEAVFTSGFTVILSYVALDLAHVPLFSDVGLANVLVVSSILACTLTLVPALLSVFGEKSFWPRKTAPPKPSRVARVTRAAIRRPKAVAGALVVFTLVATAFALATPVNINFIGLTPNSPAKVGLQEITSGFGGSTLTPTYVVVQLPESLSRGGNLFNITEMDVISNLTRDVLGFQGVSAVYGPATPLNATVPYQGFANMSVQERAAYAREVMNYVSFDNTSVYLKVVFRGDAFGNTVLREAAALSTYLGGHAPRGYRVYVGGSSIDSENVLQYVFGILPKLILVLVGAIYVVLLLQLRSAFTPLRLIATILSAVSWSLLFVWVIFYRLSGYSVFVFAPLFLVTTMLGVGTDYDIFMMVRVREEVTKGAGDDEAIVRTVESTGGVVVALGLILSSVFFSLALTSIELLRQIGVTLGLGIILDTFVGWLAFIPSVMVLAKKFNWWPSNPHAERPEE